MVGLAEINILVHGYTHRVLGNYLQPRTGALQDVCLRLSDTPFAEYMCSQGACRGPPGRRSLDL